MFTFSTAYPNNKALKWISTKFNKDNWLTLCNKSHFKHLYLFTWAVPWGQTRRCNKMELTGSCDTATPHIARLGKSRQTTECSDERLSLPGGLAFPATLTDFTWSWMWPLPPNAGYTLTPAARSGRHGGSNRCSVPVCLTIGKLAVRSPCLR